jgi:aminoglycoside phosphotransferase
MKFPSIKTKNDFDENFQNPIWTDAAKVVCLRHRISFSDIKRLASSDHVVFSIDDSLILKIYRPHRNCFEREVKALEFVGGKIDFKVPEIIQIGEIEGLDYVLMSQIQGEDFSRAIWLTLNENEQIEFVSKLALGLKQIHELKTDSFNSNWSKFVEDNAETFINRQIAHGVNPQIIESLPAFIENNLPLVPKNSPAVFMHGDVHFGNLRVQKSSGGAWEVSGLFDFADSLSGFHEYDFLAAGLLMIQGQAEIQREFFKSYGYAEKDLDETFRRRLMMLTMLYESSDLRRYALRLKPEAVDFTLEELEKAIWSFAG